MRILLLCLLLVFTVTPVRGATVEDDIERITTEVLRKEIDFERQYLKWRMIASEEPKTRRMRYFALQEAGTAAAMTAAFFSVAELGKNLQTPERVKPGPLKRGYTWGLVGGVLGGGSSAIELVSNTAIYFKHLIKHEDPESERKAVVARLKDIDGLLEQRVKLIAQLPPETEYAQMATHEGRVLQLFRDWCLFEYSDVYADIKSYQASNNIYYLSDIAAQTMVCVEYGMSTASLKRPTISGSISTIGMVSDSLFIVGAPLSTWAYNVMYKYWQKKLLKQLGRKDLTEDPENDAKKAMDDMLAHATGNGGGGGALTRASIYRTWSGRYDDYIKEGEQRLRYLDKVALQNNVSGPLISANYLAGDIMTSVAFYKCQNNPTAANALGFAAATASGSASAISMALSAQWLVRDILFERKLRKQGKMPEQLMQARLKTLDELDKLLAASSSAPPR